MELIECNKCHSKSIIKNLMSPNLKNTKKSVKSEDIKKFKYIKNKIKNYQNFIKNNFDYVGDNFSYEARSIHYNKKKISKGIYGKATTDEVKELNDEGIQTQTIPWINDKEN